MPRWASRLTLEITDVRVERLNDITKYGSVKEGVSPYGPFGEWRGSRKSEKGSMQFNAYGNPINAFRDLWNSIYSNWDENPWVWVVEFKVLEGV